MRVEQVMTREVKACTQGDTLNIAAGIMWQHDCGIVPVVSSDGDGRVVGLLTDRDVAMSAHMQGKPLWAIPVASAMARNVVTCKASDGLGRVQQLMRENQVRRVAVVDEHERLVGVISLGDIAREAERESSWSRKEVRAEDVADTLAAVSRPRGPRQVAVSA